MVVRLAIYLSVVVLVMIIISCVGCQLRRRTLIVQRTSSDSLLSLPSGCLLLSYGQRLFWRMRQNVWYVVNTILDTPSGLGMQSMLVHCTSMIPALFFCLWTLGLVLFQLQVRLRATFDQRWRCLPWWNNVIVLPVVGVYKIITRLVLLVEWE